MIVKLHTDVSGKGVEMGLNPFDIPVRAGCKDNLGRWGCPFVMTFTFMPPAPDPWRSLNALCELSSLDHTA
jgi:hypothetical protein